MSQTGLHALGGLPSCRCLLARDALYFLTVVCRLSKHLLCCRICAGQRRQYQRGRAARPRRLITAAAKRGQFEKDWENEFSPGHRLAKRSELEFEHLHSSASSSSLESGSYDGVEDDYQFNGSQSPANQKILHKLFGRHWDDLPAKYKLVFATSMAFVLCNMVSRSVALLQSFGLLLPTNCFRLSLLQFATGTLSNLVLLAGQGQH